MTDPNRSFGQFGGGRKGQEHDLSGANRKQGHRPGRILSGAAFIADHVPPVWLIDGIVQRSRLYACTSLTGHGKTAVWLFNACMIHAGRMIGHLDAFKGNVLVLAGENPADLKARMIGMAKRYDLPHDQLPFILPGSFPMTELEATALKRDIAGLRVPLAAIVGDTASSFFPGDDENSNVQAGDYARTLRTFTEECDGYPAVVVLSHPTKGANRGNLLPRGGGAFLNELDGNLALWSQSQGEVTEMHWCGKIRGPDFSPLGYRLRTVPTGLTDEKDRPEITIIAEPMSEEAIAAHTKQTLANEDAVLKALHNNPDWSFAEIASHAGWVDDDGQPERWRVQRAIATLADDKLVMQPRRRAPWELTSKGNEAIAQYAKPKAAGVAKPWTDEDVDIAPKAAPEPALPTEAEIDAEIARHNALSVKLREADRPIAAKRLRMRAGVFEKLAKAQEPKPPEPKPPEAAASEPPAPPTEAEIKAEIDRIADMSDAAFLALDREALAVRLNCKPREVTTLRSRAQAKAKEPKLPRQGSRADGTNPRALGTNPRATAHKGGKTTAKPRGKKPAPKDSQ